MPEIHCETCGRSISASASEIRYCLECGLFVCLRCWDRARDVCLECGALPRHGIRLRTARRADRRLREVARQANVLALSGGRSDEAWIEHACLGIKAETASRGGVRAWSRLKGERAERAHHLGERIRRHAYDADAALERAGVALLRRGLDGDDELLERAATEVHERGRILSGVLRRAPAAVAAVLVAAAVATIMVGGPLWFPASDGGSSPRQGTLAGNEPGSTSAAATPDPAVAEATPTATVADSLIVDFDRERMGQGLGAGWVQTAGGADAVALVPFPTAVNRSARLESADAAGAEACRTVAETTVRVSGLAVDVFLSEPATTAVVVGRNASGSPAFSVSVGASEGAFADDSGETLASGDGLPAGEWARSEITALGEQTLWRVTRETSGAVTEETVDVSALADIEQVCLAVSSGSSGAAHFDNLTIATVEEG